MGFLNAYTQIETVCWKMLACWPSLHYTTTSVFGMYISDLKPSSSWSSLHYTTTLDFCIHIFKLKGPLERNQMIGQPYTTPLQGFFECIYSVWRPLATVQAYTTPLMGFLNAYTQIETVSLKMLACWPRLHYTTTWVFCTHIFKLKRSLDKCLLVG